MMEQELSFALSCLVAMKNILGLSLCICGVLLGRTLAAKFANKFGRKPARFKLLKGENTAIERSV